MISFFSVLTVVAMLSLSVCVGVISYKAIHGQPSMPFIKAALACLAVILISAAVVFSQST